MPSITKPSNAVDINDHKNILKCKMHAYLAFGTMEDDEIPVYAKDIADMIEEGGDNQVFVPLGDLAKDPIEYGWSRETEELHAGKKRSLLNVEGSIKCINVGSDMIDLLDEKGFAGDCTLMLLPFRNPDWEDVDEDNPMFAVIVRGVSIVDSGKGTGNNKFGEVVLSYNAQPDEIGDGILMLKYAGFDPGRIVSSVLFIDALSDQNEWDEAEEKWTVIADLSDNGEGFSYNLMGKAGDGAFMLSSGNVQAWLNSDCVAKTIIAVVSPSNAPNLGEMTLLTDGEDANMSLRGGGDQMCFTDGEGNIISGTIGDTIGAKSLIEINTEYAPYMKCNGADLSAYKDAVFNAPRIDYIGGKQGDEYIGSLYGLFIAGAALSATEQAMVVNWMKKRYGVTGW